MHSQLRPSLNATRTPDEKAAFKAANLTAARRTVFIPRVRTPETMPAPKGKTFTIAWQTSLGCFGWPKFVGCRDMEEAVECFNASRRNGGNVPFDACIDVIKPA